MNLTFSTEQLEISEIIIHVFKEFKLIRQIDNYVIFLVLNGIQRSLHVIY